MKNSFFFAVFVLLFWQCSDNHESELTFYEREVKFMQALTPQLVGTWNLQQASLSWQRHKISNQNTLQLSKDTIFYNLATLEIRPASNLRNPWRQAQHPEFEGSIQFRDKIYPIYFYLIAAPYSGKAFFLLQYSFPVGMHIPEAEERFLKDIGLINENFSLELLPGKSTMIWEGLNRGFDKIELVKLQ